MLQLFAAATAATPTASTPSPPNCADTHASCYYWATVGECESNHVFMKRTCAAACGDCAEPSTPATVHARVDAAGGATTDGGGGGPKLVLVGNGGAARLPLGQLAADPITRLSAGELHLLLLTASGAVLSWGDGRMGQLGHPRTTSRLPFTAQPPRRVEWPAPHNGRPASAVSAGHFFSAAVLADGALLMWGDNAHGQLGAPADALPLDSAPPEVELIDAAISSPTAVRLRVAVAAVSCGETHTLALTTDGRLIAWGDNAYGQLGNVTDSTSSSPFVVPLPLKDGETPTEVHAGAFHSLIVTSTGRLLVFGDNSFGQLGRGRGGFMHSLLHERPADEVSEEKFDAELIEAAAPSELVLDALPESDGVLHAATFAFHSAVVTKAGRLLVWGDNHFGQLGMEPSNSSEVGESHSAEPLGPAHGAFVVHAALGEYHTYALTNASSLLTIGFNEKGQLGRMRGASWDAYPAAAELPLRAHEAPLAVVSSAFFGAALGSSGDVYVWGETPLPAEADTVAAEIEAEEEAEAEAEARAAASVEAGAEAASPAEAPTSGTVAAAVRDEPFAEVRLGGGIAVGGVCVGGFHVVAAAAGGAHYSWGENAMGQLCRDPDAELDATPAPVAPLPGGGAAIAVGCGAFHSAASSAHGVFGCGEGYGDSRRGAAGADDDDDDADGDDDEDGDGRRGGRGGRRMAAAVEVGGASMPTVTSGGGGGGGGRARQPQTVWHPVALSLDRAEEVRSLALGQAHSLALTSDGRIFSWGTNVYGQLGWAPLGNRAAAGDGDVGVLPPGEVVLRRGSTDGRPTFVEPQPATYIAAGPYHSLAIGVDGAAFSWGSNSHGQLARPTNEPLGERPYVVPLPAAAAGRDVVGLAAGVHHTLFLLSDGRVCALGDNLHGQAGRPRPTRAGACTVATSVAKVAAGELHSIALTAAHEVLTWGANHQQQCGRRPERLLLQTPGRVQLPLGADDVAVRVSAGGYRSAVVSRRGRLFLLGRMADAAAEEEEIEMEEAALDAQEEALEAEEGAERGEYYDEEGGEYYDTELDALAAEELQDYDAEW